MIGQSYQEKLVQELNRFCITQTEALPIILEPFEYVSSGNGWAIRFLGNGLAGDEKEGSMEEDELQEHVLVEARQLIDSIKALKL